MTTPNDCFELTVLGSGTSQGVPLIGCDCSVCTSPDPRDRRTRASIYVNDGHCPFLVDTSPELRLQCLREGIIRADAVVFTHPHADHIMGFDDLRRFCEMTEKRIPIYGSPESIKSLQSIFSYAFDPEQQLTTYVRAIPHIVREPFQLGSLLLTPLPVPHGRMPTYGYLMEREGRKLLAYLSDCSAVPQEIRQKIAHVEVLLIDGLRETPHPTHLTSQQAIEIGLAVNAGQTYLTHLTHHKSHQDREVGLPESCFIAYDGLKITL